MYKILKKIESGKENGRHRFTLGYQEKIEGNTICPLEMQQLGL
jgi:hypothetical protein